MAYKCLTVSGRLCSNLNRSRDYEKIWNLIGIGLVLYVVSLIILTVGLFKRVEVGSGNPETSESSDATKQHLKSALTDTLPALNTLASIRKLQFFALKKALLEHNITEQKERFALDKVSMTRG